MTCIAWFWRRRRYGESCAGDNKTPRYLDQTSMSTEGTAQVQQGDVWLQGRPSSACCDVLCCCKKGLSSSRERDERERARPAVLCLPYLY